jgi:hypothetical protein
MTIEAELSRRAALGGFAVGYDDHKHKENPPAAGASGLIEYYRAY